VSDVVDVSVVRRPAPPLRPLIDAYIGYRLAGFPPALHRGVPARHMTFIVSIGPPIVVAAQPRPADAPRAYRCVVGGLQESAALIAHDGNQEGVAVELTPLGSRRLFGMPAQALWGTALELGDVAGAAGDELWERLQHATTWHDRFAVCDEVLARLVCRTDDPGGAGGAATPTVAPELARSWQALVASGGQVSVRELAERTGYSRQHLGRRFRAEFGLGPKLAARVIRFDRARTMLQSLPPDVSVADVAAACGYYDQAHLHRDVADLAGCTPRELLADIELPVAPGANVPSVQDVAVAAV
jgi:AraC-like DNA-binding protein